MTPTGSERKSRNPLRWILFYYILGTIAACFVIFIEELVHPLDVPHIFKTLFVTLFFPCLIIILSIAEASYRERRRKGE